MPSLPRPGDRLAGFRVERELGHGTTGTVFLAHQEALDRNVALKVVGRPLADDAGFRERFRHEARAAAGLDHPNVVQILETGEDDAHLWLAMRLVDGPDLRVLLRRTGRLEPAQAVAVVEQIAAALDAAHATGLVHRDVKPSNVLIEDGPGRDLHVELADFGLARTPGVDDPEGTPGYAAPEQLAGAESGPAADVFGLGCVLFELLTGTPPPVVVPSGVPWRDGPGASPVEDPAGDPPPAGDPGDDEESVAASARHTVESPAVAPSGGDAGTTPAPPPARVYGDLLPLTPSVALPRLGGAFDPAVQRATAADPAARFASAGELAMWARAALSVPRNVVAADPADPVRVAAATPASPAEVGPAAPTWEIAPSPQRRRRGRRLLVAVFLAVVLGLLGAAFFFIGDLGDASRDRTAGTTPTPPGGTTASRTGGPAGGAGSSSGSAGRGSAGGSAGSSSSAGAGSGSGGSGSGGSGTGPGTGTGGAAGSAASGATGNGSRGSAGGSAPGTSGSAGGSDSGASGSASAGGSGSGGAGSGSVGGSGVPSAGGTSAARGGGATGGPGSSVPRAGRAAPTGPASPALPPVPAGFVRFGGGVWVLDLPAAEGWRQTATQELDGGTRLVTRLLRPDAVRLVVEALPGRTAVVGVPDARTFPVRLPDAGRTDGALYRGGRYAMCRAGVCAALPANGPNGGVLLIASAHRAAGAKRIARRAASGLRVR